MLFRFWINVHSFWFLLIDIRYHIISWKCFVRKCRNLFYCIRTRIYCCCRKKKIERHSFIHDNLFHFIVFSHYFLFSQFVDDRSVYNNQFRLCLQTISMMTMRREKNSLLSFTMNECWFRLNTDLENKIIFIQFKSQSRNSFFFESNNNIR